jgi:hypothetical protein
MCIMKILDFLLWLLQWICILIVVFFSIHDKNFFMVAGFILGFCFAVCSYLLNRIKTLPRWMKIFSF